MKLSQRVPRSEIHFYIQKLIRRGYKKIEATHHIGGYVVKLERTVNGKYERLTVKFSNNGWCTMT